MLAQDRTDWEIVVIDDGDRDAAAHVAPYLADPRIRFLETDNGGPSTARNRAMATVTTPMWRCSTATTSMSPTSCPR
ncbi:glycosyltransferase [Rhizorhabdus histidinilytica]